MSSKPSNGWSTADFNHAGSAVFVVPACEGFKVFATGIHDEYVGNIASLPEESGKQYTDAGYVVDFDVDTVRVKSTA